MSRTNIGFHRRVGVGLLLLAVCFGAKIDWAQGQERGPRVQSVANATVDPSADRVPAGNQVPVDFSGVLARVSGQNPQVAFANERISEAFARLDGAEALWLPAIRAGVSYNKHDGALQNVDGTVVEHSRSAMEAGMGAQASGTGSPAVPGAYANFRITDAIFQPRIADEEVAARRHSAVAVCHDLLLSAALAYLDLLRAYQQQAITEETLQNAERLAQLTADFARTGAGSEADADRAQAELAVRRNDAMRAAEQARVASARVAELMSVDATAILVPREATIVPIDLVPRNLPASELVAQGLSRRPELAESRHLVAEAIQRLQRERYAPLVPSVLLGISQSGFGGGRGDTLTNFGSRYDLDATAYWEVRNFGLGEGAVRREARALVEQARLRQVQLMDRVAREVVEAHWQTESRRGQIPVAQSGIQMATNSYRRNMERIRRGQGLPIEVLQAIQALDQSRREYLRTVSDFNEAQFKLYRALGSPISQASQPQ